MALNSCEMSSAWQKNTHQVLFSLTRLMQLVQNGEWGDPSLQNCVFGTELGLSVTIPLQAVNVKSNVPCWSC